MSKFDWDSVGRLGKKVAGTLQDAAESVSKKTEEVVNTQKIKHEISTLQIQNKDDYAEIGKILYEEFKNGNIENEDVKKICEEIEKRDELIKVKKSELEQSINKKTCKNCGHQMKEESVFCAECGEKYEEENLGSDSTCNEAPEEVSDVIPEAIVEETQETENSIVESISDEIIEEDIKED